LLNRDDAPSIEYDHRVAVLPDIALCSSLDLLGRAETPPHSFARVAQRYVLRSLPQRSL
jgi:hypothetical protein